MNEPTTEAGRVLLAREAYNERSFPLIEPAAIVAIEQEAVAKYRRAIEALDFDTDRDRAAVLALLGEPNDD